MHAACWLLSRGGGESGPARYTARSRRSSRPRVAAIAELTDAELTNERLGAPYGWFLASGGSWFASWGMQQVLFAWLLVDVLNEDAARVGTAQMVGTLPSVVFLLLGGALADRVDDALPVFLLFVLGAVVLLASFQLFDRVLPNLDPPSPRLERVLTFLHRPLAMFLMGGLVTLATLSVSISLTLLVPLSLKAARVDPRNGAAPGTIRLTDEINGAIDDPRSGAGCCPWPILRPGKGGARP